MLETVKAWKHGYTVVKKNTHAVNPLSIQLHFSGSSTSK